MWFSSAQRHPSSYRDPSGYVFWHNHELYRQVNKSFKDDFDFFLTSGLYDYLTQKELLIPHKIIPENLTGDDDYYRTLKSERLSFISYPYEWCFTMLKDAALVTLALAQESMQYGMMLKDASPYNIQFHNGNLIFIDTLSFEKWDSIKPWIAYRQFCENFLAPLSLMHYTQLPLQSLLLAFPDGIPISYAKKLLPWKTGLNLHMYLHIHVQNHYTKSSASKKETGTLSPQKLKNIFKSLTALIQSFSLNYKGTWSHYYDEAEQREGYLPCKKRIIESWINDDVSIKTAIDVGSNDGTFSKLSGSKNIDIISADSDHAAIDKLYKEIKEKKVRNLTPLIIDFANPTPATGLNNTERASLFSRVRADLVLALAVIHHLAIGNNIPFDDMATLFKSLGKKLIVEFIPKKDDKISSMLQQKKDIYSWYNEESFKVVFSRHYKLIASEKIANSGRILYLMERHEV